MRILGIAPLFLALALITESGVSQAVQNKRCPNCKKGIDGTDGPTKLSWLIKAGVKSYTICPGSHVRFQLTKGEYCILNHLSTTKTLMTCIDEDNCKDLVSSNSKQDFSKGATKNPSTTIQSTTTTPHVTSQNTTPQWIPNIINSTEATEREKSTSSKSPVLHHPKNDSINAHQGDKLPKASDSAPEESDGKMKNMRTTIMALIFIILVMVGVSTGAYCRKKKRLCLSRSVYRAASSQDSLEMEKAP